MESGFYVTLSAQAALQRRLETIATNMANVNTPGYRAEEVSFASLLARRSEGEVAFASTGESYISRRGGAAIKTGNPLDVAVQGDGWLAVQSANGVAYTRDGRLSFGEDGILRSVGGRPVLDAGGAPLTIDPNGGPPSIARDGMITQAGRQIGALGLFEIEPGARLARGADSTVIPDRPAAPILDFVANGVMQGHIENANANPVLEMTKLIAVSRIFDQISAMLQASESTYGDAIRGLGAPA